MARTKCTYSNISLLGELTLLKHFFVSTFFSVQLSHFNEKRKVSGLRVSRLRLVSSMWLDDKKDIRTTPCQTNCCNQFEIGVGQITQY